ncbi:MAG: cytochrome c oxidase subunit II [Methylotenera sp.]|uniref:cytochrome c oxidase subunit II n=1 Tax=Methylotenera sp. TaxID=2051956 RepID=UPI00271D7BF9|nr:cytochrome c oxidase subunit II [Methylotenera sp.]MDO9393291.1 cytochrome c oxidase subunit II [Methylotenera sp.]MDP1523054.1 cytochrome c oxidase subunit II [Methylotenera sp.]
MQVFKKIGLGLFAFLASLNAYAEYSWNFPEPVTPMALDTLHVHNKFMLITMAIFVVVLAIMIYSIFAHRKSKGYKAVADKAPSTAVEIFWTLIPFVILLLIDFVIMGIPAYHSVIMMEDTRDKATMVVKVTGSQWRWQYEYMDGDAKGIKFVSNLSTPKEQTDKGFDGKKDEQYLLEVDNRLVLPVGEKVRILMTATDVMHNWWVPQFGSSRLAVPGFIRETWVQVDKAGTYRGQCKELCGKGHGYMPVVVDAVPMNEFKVWVATKKEELAKADAGADKEWTKEELVATGKGVYDKNCAVCHQVSGAGLPPAFPALTGSKAVTSPIFGEDGKYLKDGHLDRVLNGIRVMPGWKALLNDTEIASVITYERNALGNSVGDVLQPAQVKAARQ